MSEEEERVYVPEKYFMYLGAAAKDENSLYQCMHCPKGSQQKALSCYNKSRQQPI